VSWDLDFVPLGREGAEFLDEPPDGPRALAQAKAVRERYPQLELFAAPDGSVELSPSHDDPLVPVTVSLFGHHAAINVAYWNLGEQASALAEMLGGIATVLGEHGFVAFDPQQNRVIEVQELRDAFATGHAFGFEQTERIAGKLRSEQSAAVRRARPWWQKPTLGTGALAAALIIWLAHRLGLR
jgi:hypothetical protein